MLIELNTFSRHLSIDAATALPTLICMNDFVRTASETAEMQQRRIRSLRLL